MDLSGRECKAAQEAIRSSEEVHFIAPEQTLGRTSMLYSHTMVAHIMNLHSGKMLASIWNGCSIHRDYTAQLCDAGNTKNFGRLCRQGTGSSFFVAMVDATIK
jgi:hypothetical protein